MKKVLVSGGIAILTIPSLCYYITKYYVQKTLNFKESMFFAFVVVCSLIILGLLLGVYNTFQNSQLHHQNDELIKQNLQLSEEIEDLKDFVEKCHYEDIEYHNNNRELILDLENENDK